MIFNQFWIRIVVVTCCTISMQGCGEIESDLGGPIKAYFVLQGADGRVRDFYLESGH